MARLRKKETAAQAAWDRIQALGGHGVWDGAMCVVSFAGTAITDDELKLFEDFPFVQTLDLSGTSVGDAGLKHLAGLPDLRSLILVNTKISQSAIDEFRRRHPDVEVTTQPTPKGKINPFTGKPSD